MEDPVSGVENPVNMDNPVNPVENPVNPVNPVKNPVTTQENSTESVASPVLPVVNPINRVEQVYELPGGWVKKIIPRKSGTSQGQWDAYLFTPDGTKIRSNQDLIKYLAATGLQIDPYVINMDKSCVKDKEGGRSKPSKGVMVLRDALRRMASGEQVTPDNSFRGFKDPNAPAVTSSSSSYAFEKSEYYSDAEVTVKSFSKKPCPLSKKFAAKKLNSRILDLTQEDCPLFIDLNTRIVEAVIIDEDGNPVESESEAGPSGDSKFESHDAEYLEPMDAETPWVMEHDDDDVQETVDDDPFKEIHHDIENFEHEVEHVDGEVFEIKKEAKKGKPKKRSTEQTWYKGCEYLCKVCNETRDSTEHIRNHVKKYHPELQHNDPSNYDMIKEDYFDCVICDENMLRDYLIIKMHVRSRHKMGMVEYANEYVFRS